MGIAAHPKPLRIIYPIMHLYILISNYAMNIQTTAVRQYATAYCLTAVSY